VGFGKAGDELYGIGILAAVKHPLPRDEYIVEDDHGGLSLTEDGVAQFLQVVGQISFRRIGGVLADVGDAFGIGGRGKSYGVVLFAFEVSGLRQNDHLVACESAADVDLGASNDDAFFILVHYLEGKIRVRPVQGFLAATAPGFGQRAGNGKILSLNHLEIFQKARAILGAQVPVHFPGGAGQGVKGVVADTPIDAGPKVFRREGPGLRFLDQIIRAAAHMSIAIDHIIDQRRVAGHDVFRYGVKSPGVAGLVCLHHGSSVSILKNAFHPFPVHEDFWFHCFEAFFECLGSHKGHGGTSLRME
jgi:hypothetical protein